MTESSSDRTKRLLIGSLTKYQWSYQYSIFYADIDDCHLLIKETNSLKRKLMKKHPKTSFLVCYRLHIKGRRFQAYTTIFASEKTGQLIEYASQSFTDHKVVYRRFTAEKLASTVKAIKRQKLHDLEGFFNHKIRRYQLINKCSLILK